MGVCAMAGDSNYSRRVCILWLSLRSLFPSAMLYNLNPSSCYHWCRYILMAEPDHIFVNPLPNLAHGEHPAAFPFFYIKPAENEKIIRKFYSEEKGPVTNVDPIGNSPVIIKKVESGL